MNIKEKASYIKGLMAGMELDESKKELLLGSYSTVGIGIYRANGNTYIACLLVG